MRTGLGFLVLVGTLAACGSGASGSFTDAQDLLARGDEGWEDEDYSEHCDDLLDWMDELEASVEACWSETPIRDSPSGGDSPMDSDDDTDADEDGDSDLDCQDVADTLSRAEVVYERDCSDTSSGGTDADDDTEQDTERGSTPMGG